ncbi:MAG TPA: ABC transporter ATP-binding protein [Flavobacterium sp.]|nr:ABC transporter ATP-binding protein [Flavobacterium sp.]
MSMIQVHDISKQYKQSDYFSLQEVRFSINEGAIFGLLGPNGAGKTTLISILCGLIKATSGSFEIAGYHSKNQMAAIRKIIGIVPQEYALYPTLTAYENLMYFGSLYNLSKKNLQQLIEEYLVLLGLENFMHKKIQTFSGGMKRRVNLIAGILHQPNVLFLDEPTVGVDVQSRTRIIEFLNEQNKKGTTIVYTSHLMAEAQEFCTDIAIIDQGTILKQGSVTDLIASVPNAKSLEEVFISLTGKTLRDGI